MHSECRSFLKKHIEVKLEKDPESEAADVRACILSGVQQFDLSMVNRKTLNSFIERALARFRGRGSLKKKLAQEGQPSQGSKQPR